MFKIILLILMLVSSNVEANTRNGLLGWWKFDDSGATAVDSTTGGNNGSVNGTAVVPTCMRGACKSFDGSTGVVTLNNSLGAPDTTFTACHWLQTTSTANQYSFSQQGNVSNIGGWGIGVTNGGTAGKFAVVLKSLTGTNVYVVEGTNSVNDGIWHHVCAVITTSTTVPGNNVATLYIDGATGQGAPITNAVNFQNTVESARIGARTTSGASSTFFSGLLDDVRIYSRALTAQEVKDIYTSGTYYKTPNF